MLNRQKFYDALCRNGIKFYTGVPDSYLNEFCNYLLLHVPKERNVIAANEGNAIGIAAGYYFASKDIPLVYMQNSGIGNAMNPLVSLADKNVYSIPMLLLIGWRGQPDTDDWAQHKTQGEITTKILEAMSLPFLIVEDDDNFIERDIKWAVITAKNKKRPVALVVGKGILSEKKTLGDRNNGYLMSRENAIETILDALPSDTIYSATTGRTTRELYFLREKRGEGHQYDFLNVGSMGHASSVALGMTLAKRKRKIVCMDGDSAAIMHMGSMTMVSKLEVNNFMHIILNNGVHESVGGQPSAGYKIDFTGIAQASGYATIGGPVTSKEELFDALDFLKNADRATFLDVRIHSGLCRELLPLKISHQKIIDGLIEELNNNE